MSFEDSVVAMGYSIADLVFTLKEPLLIDGKTSAAGFATYAGGQAANAAATMATLGLRVALIAAFGDDGLGAACRTALLTRGVDLSFSRILAGCPHHMACVLVSGEQRSIVMYKDPRLVLDSLLVPQHVVATCGAVYTDGYEGTAAVALARQASTFGKPVISDLEVIGPHSEELVGLTTHLVAPAPVLMRIAGKSDLDNALVELLSRGPQAVVATRGAQGAIGRERGAARAIEVPASPCRAIDTTGAGDAYHAAYVAALQHGAPLVERMRFGADIAALKCATPGPNVDASAFRSRFRPTGA
jgi:sulfofructose kinase